MFEEKSITYKLRDRNLLNQAMFQKINYSKNTFKYYEMHTWNHSPDALKRNLALAC